MTEPGPHFFRFCVVLEGWELFAITRVLSRHLPEYLESLPLHLRRPLEDRLAECLAMSREWKEDRKRGTAEPAAAALPVESKEMDKPLTTDQAAELLQVSDRYIRKLIASGALPARKDRCGWHVDAGAVHEYHERTGGAK